MEWIHGSNPSCTSWFEHAHKGAFHSTYWASIDVIAALQTTYLMAAWSHYAIDRIRKANDALGKQSTLDG